MKITNKKRMYRELMAGTFGNYMQVWESLEDCLASGYGGEISIRSKTVSHPVKLYHVPWADLEQTVANLPPEVRFNLTFCESPADAGRTIQGELMRSRRGLELHYSYSPLAMRFALEQDGQHAHGLVAGMLLQFQLDPSDYEWLLELLDSYPDHVIEFTGFREPVGVYRRKMVVWEVRDY